MQRVPITPPSSFKHEVTALTAMTAHGDTDNTEIRIVIPAPVRHAGTTPQPIVDWALNVPRFCIDLMGKRPPSKGWNECGFYVEWTPDFGSNWG